MKLSFEARFCRFPVDSWAFVLNIIPLSSDTRLARLCAHSLPSEPADMRTFLHACCILLLLNYIPSFVCLLATGTDKGRYLHYTLILWQTHCLLAQAYIWHQVTNYQRVSELLLLIPLCTILLLVDACYAVAFNGGPRTVARSLFRTILVVHQAVVWAMQLLSLTCAVHREYADCTFIS